MDAEQKIMEVLDCIVKRIDEIKEVQEAINEKLDKKSQRVQETVQIDSSLDEIQSRIVKFPQESRNLSIEEKSCNNEIDPILRDIWIRATEVIKKELTEISFNTWIKPIKPLRIENDKIHIVVMNEFTAGIVEARYTSLIRNAISVISGKEYEIEVFVEKGNKSIKKENHPMEEQQKTKHTFDTFIIGECNYFAYKAAFQFAQNPQEKPTLLYLYGKVGLGKTHLLKAVEAEIRASHPSLKVKYMTIEDFMNKMITNIAKDCSREFTEEIMQQDILLLDNLQHTIGKEYTQKELIGILYEMLEGGKRVFIASTKSPEETLLSNEKFTSLFEIGYVLSLEEPDYNTRMKILEKKEKEGDVFLENDVLIYIANHFSSNVREIINAFNRMISYQKLTGKKADEEIAKQIFEQ